MLGGNFMNNVNEWIPHLQHPLVLVGFALFIFALVIKPLFLNSKKLTGPLIAPLLRWGMILLFILAAMAMVGGFALSWKATPAASSDSGLTEEKHRQILREELARANKESQAPGLAAEERRLLVLKAKVLEEKLVNLQQSYEEALKLRKEADGAVAKLKGQLPEAKIEKAQVSLRQGEIKAAKETFAEVRKQAGKAAAFAAYHEGKLAEGEVNYAEAMELYRTAVMLEKDNPDYLRAAGNMARKLGNYAQAQEWLERLLKIREAEGKEDVELSSTQHELAILYEDIDKYNEAEKLYRRSLSIKEKIFGEENFELLSSLNNLVLLYRRQGRYEEAEPLFQRLIAISEKTLGKGHPRVVEAMNSMAVFYEKHGNYAKAELLFQRALEISEKTLGKEHPRVAEAMNSMAVLYEKMGNYEKSELFFQRVVEIRKKNLGNEHPHVAAAMNNLATFYESRHRYNEAESLYQTSLSILKKNFPLGHRYIDKLQKNYDELKRKQAGQ
jgi:tetratricopeptide (TPR) repeat protein